MSAEEKYRDLLVAAVKFNKAQRIDPLKQGNLFTILDMENKEVSAHSSFLSFVFQPFEKENDEYDDKNLRQLLNCLLKAKRARYDCPTTDARNYKFLDIRREVSVDFGRLDFVITADDEIFVIELKIWAKEQHKQISRYRQYLAEQGADEKNIFFLTPTKRPSETGESINITLKDDMRQTLEIICKSREQEGHKEYAVMLKQYIDIINKLTQGENFMGEPLDAIRTADELRAVGRLVDNRDRKLQEMMIDFFAKLKNELSDELKVDGCPAATRVQYRYGDDSIHNYYSQTRCWPALAYEIEPCKLQSGCKLKDGFDLYFFIEVEANLYCGITPRRRDLSTVDCDDAIENITKIQSKQHTKVFVAWHHLTINDGKINFSVKALNDRESILRLLSKDELLIDDKYIKELATQIKAKYKEYCDHIFEK